MVTVFVVFAMIGRPVQAGVLKRAGTEEKGEEFDRPLGLEREVGKQSVVSKSNTHCGGHRIEKEHAGKEPINSELEDVDGNSDDGDERRSYEEDTGDPVNAVKRYFGHSCWYG